MDRKLMQGLPGTDARYSRRNKGRRLNVKEYDAEWVTDYFSCWQDGSPKEYHKWDYDWKKQALIHDDREKTCGVMQCYYTKEGELKSKYYHRCPQCDDQYKRYKRATRVADAIEGREDYDPKKLSVFTLSYGTRPLVVGWREEDQVIKDHLQEMKRRFTAMRNRKWFRTTVTNYMYVYEFTRQVLIPDMTGRGMDIVTLNSHLHCIVETNQSSTTTLRKQLEQQWHEVTGHWVYTWGKQLRLKDGSTKPTVRYFVKYLTKQDRHRALAGKRMWHSTFKKLE